MHKIANQQRFHWRGKNKLGQTVHGELMATAVYMVKLELRRQGIIATTIRKPARWSLLPSQTKVKTSDIALFTRQLATLVSANIPIVQALTMLQQGQRTNMLRHAIVDIQLAVESGTPLAQAFAAHPHLFNRLFVSLISAGEQAGALDTMLNRVAQYLEKAERLRANLKKAMFYPVSVIVIALLISAGLLTFIVPQFVNIFQSFGATLPLPTQLVIALSSYLSHYGWLWVSLTLMGLWGLRWTIRRFEAVAYRFDHMLITMRVIGPLLQKTAMSRMASTLATTLAAGMPLIDALHAVTEASGNRVLTKAMIDVRNHVLTGQRLHIIMQQHTIFLPLVTQMVAVGEESGTLELMLTKIAASFDEQVDQAVSQLSTLLEPMIMVVLGVLIGGLVIALYLPIFQMGAVVGAK